jgi:DNA (cytosine-5)-methyltransferase 1
VRVGLEPHFQTVWANDNCSKKAAVYAANFGADGFFLGNVEDVKGVDLPEAELAWASFPCQDLSLAGNMQGMNAGTRSGLFWDWVRILDELGKAGKRPRILVAENVVGFLVADGGAHLKAAYDALRNRGYRAGAVVVDARHFLPQSRPRAFLIAAGEDIALEGLVQHGPSEPFHTPGVVRAAAAVRDREWVWWALPPPRERPPRFENLCERDAPCDSPARIEALRDLLSPLNRNKLEAALSSARFLVGTGYKRTRPIQGKKRQQRLELRFDGIAGCLRTPEGGSSRQMVVIVERGKVRTRLMTVRECARLMGAPESFQLPGSYNDGYRAMGDGVAVPVTRWLSQQILAPLAARIRKRRAA